LIAGASSERLRTVSIMAFPSLIARWRPLRLVASARSVTRRIIRSHQGPRTSSMLEHLRRGYRRIAKFKMTYLLHSLLNEIQECTGQCGVASAFVAFWTRNGSRAPRLITKSRARFCFISRAPTCLARTAGCGRNNHCSDRTIDPSSSAGMNQKVFPLRNRAKIAANHPQ
jgi:hypothetical protein